jgi:hypothetical protein
VPVPAIIPPPSYLDKGPFVFPGVICTLFPDVPSDVLEKTNVTALPLVAALNKYFDAICIYPTTTLQIDQIGADVAATFQSGVPRKINFTYATGTIILDNVKSAVVAGHPKWKLRLMAVFAPAYLYVWNNVWWKYESGAKHEWEVLPAGTRVTAGLMAYIYVPGV